MKVIYAILVCLYASGVCAQNHGPDKEKIDSAKAIFITQRLDLSEDQFRKFWPVYHQFHDRKKVIRQSLRTLKMAQRNGLATDDQVIENIKRMLQLKKEDVAIEETYINKIIGILSPKQIADLYKAENDFIKMLRERIHKKNKDR